MPANRDETGRFVKGKSGNPSGRPKVPEQFKELVQEKSIPALRAIIAISGSRRWYRRSNGNHQQEGQ